MMDSTERKRIVGGGARGEGKRETDEQIETDTQTDGETDTQKGGGPSKDLRPFRKLSF